MRYQVTSRQARSATLIADGHNAGKPVPAALPDQALRRVSARDQLTETVTIQPEDGDPIQLGFQAAGRVLVEEVTEDAEPR